VDDSIDGTLSRQTLYTYDPIWQQQLASVTSPEGEIDYRYDAATGQLTETSTADADTTYGYDALGRLTTVTVDKLNGQTLTTPLVTSYGYDAAGNQTSETLPNGVVTVYTYDDLNRLTDVVETLSGQTLFGQHYTLNTNGTRASVSETELQSDGTTESISTVWTYDALNRLISETVTASISSQSYSDTYTYDLASNRMTKTHTGPGDGADETITYEYNSNDELVSQSSSLSGTTTFEYDANGSLTTHTHGSNVTIYTYNVRGKLVTITVNGTVVATYTYDDWGNRISETAGGVTTMYLIDTKNPTGYSQPLETYLNGSPTSGVTYLIGKRVYSQIAANGTATYLTTDGHGSTRVLIDAAGNVLQTFNYDAFGAAINFNAATAPTIFLYAGDAVYDAASGLYLHGDGVRGRLEFYFVERDSYAGKAQDPLSLHKYVYAYANPVNFIDASGHNAVGAVAGGIAAAILTVIFFPELLTLAAVGGIYTIIGGGALTGLVGWGAYGGWEATEVAGGPGLTTVKSIEVGFIGGWLFTMPFLLF
jgi:YD repeat-containing protein